jgi:hypothetical protein
VASELDFASYEGNAYASQRDEVGSNCCIKCQMILRATLQLLDDNCLRVAFKAGRAENAVR